VESGSVLVGRESVPGLFSSVVVIPVH